MVVPSISLQPLIPMIRAAIPAIIVASTVLTACVQTNASLMDTSVRMARTCPAAVKLFSSPSKVTSDYQEIALLNASGSSMYTNESNMTGSMRKKAAEVGANGIIMGNIDEPSAGAKVAAAVFGAHTERKGKAVAIYIPADSARAQQVCSNTSTKN
jgi:hypothetical protein